MLAAVRRTCTCSRSWCSVSVSPCRAFSRHPTKKENAMAQPYVGEIRLFAGNFAPSGWMFCAGQLVPISENDALFTLIGTTYGGDGQETFALPDLRGRLPLHQGGAFILGQSGGVEEVTLTVPQISAHSHPLLGSTSN